MRCFLSILILLFTLMSCEQAEEQPTVKNVIVIGGGLMGSSTAWELSKAGEEVLLLEQQDSVYTYGSSYGEARITRNLGTEYDMFSFIQHLSVTETEELIRYLNEADNNNNHTMNEVYRTSPVTYIRYQSQQDEVDELVKDPDVELTYAAGKDDAKRRFDMNIPDSLRIIREYKAYSGTMNPKVLIHKLHQAVKYKGNRVQYNNRVTALTQADSLYRVQVENTQTGEMNTILCRKVVAAAGPYNGQLVQDLAPYFARLITPSRLFLAYLKIKPDVYNGLSDQEKEKLNDAYPVLDHDDELFYSMFENTDEAGVPILKVGGHYLRSAIDSLDQAWKIKVSQEEINWSKQHTAAYLEMLNLPVQMEDLEYVKGYSCVYSLTDSEVPYVTHRVNSNQQVDSSFVLVGGMSGVGAKGSLAYGLMAANLLTNKTDTSYMYQKTIRNLGTSRLLEDLDNLYEPYEGGKTAVNVKKTNSNH